MRRLTHKRSRKSGLPPGTPVHIGERKAGAPRVSLMQYDGEQLVEEEMTDVSACRTWLSRPGVTWINIEGVHQIDLLERLGECVGLHSLVLEDIANTGQRPKAEDYGGYLYVVLRMLSLQAASQEVVGEQVSLIVGPNFVISFQEGIAGDAFNPIRERLRTAKGRVRREGADYLVYSLIDAIVDGYFVLLEKLGEQIEVLDERMLANRAGDVARTIHLLKREMIWLRKAVWPLREMINTLQHAETPLIRASTGVYLKDVYDHTIEVIDTVETYRDVLSGMLENHLSLLTTRLNEIMKVLTVISTIFIPLTFITGIYGMNFRFMPELEWRWGYPLSLLAMVIIGVAMYFYYRRKKWL
ncbi:MAG TPA: magnesium/cobalt transporter CorA [Acidiferrobacterales bacterium]|nr:magnesium/cobalt transporter CorA [Acidiferrobacterales bacterium]